MEEKTKDVFPMREEELEADELALVGEVVVKPAQRA